MPERSSATLTDEAVWEILTRLRLIDQGNPKGDTQSLIAADYGVEKKTISRIKTGKTWGKIKLRFDEDPNHRQEVAPVVYLEPDSDEVLDLMSTLTGAKNQFCLDHDKPVHFGRFDWIDGIHAVVTDGLIMWESESMYRLATKIEATGLKKHPFFASKADELPTLEISRMMTLPINQEFVEREDYATGVSKLISEEGKVVFLQERYMRVIDRNKFQVHLAGDQTDFVYLTKSIIKNKKTDQGDTVVISHVMVVHAAVATMETQCLKK